jgi:hypothetical protein
MRVRRLVPRLADSRRASIFALLFLGGKHSRRRTIR